MRLVCTPCGIPLGENQSAIVGVKTPGGKRLFRWACKHKPVENAEVVIASNKCALIWVDAHPEDDEPISRLLALADGNPEHPGCDKHNDGRYN